jgi:hypothetical protein
MKILRLLITLTLAASFPVFAADAPKKPKKAPASLAEQTLKKLEVAKLTDDQVAKIKELAAAAEPKLNELRKAVGLTDAQRAAQKEAMDKAKAEGKKGKDLNDAVEAAMQLTPDQKTAQKAVREANMEFDKSVTGLLTPEQKKAAGMGPKKPKGT